jgi:hypothetical protein
MITIIDVINNTTNTEQTYGLFFIILNKFLNLLQDQNNIYKNKDFCIDTINNLLKEDKLSIRNCSTFIIMSIYNENLTQYNNTNHKQTKLIEKEIINNLVFILSQNVILIHVIEIINNILLVNLEEYYNNYKEYYGCDININYDAIVKIDSDNIKDVYENFHKLKRLILIAKLEESYNMKEINEVDNCLFCLFYYSD